MYLLVGYQIMYGGGYLLDGIVNDGAESADDLVAFVLAESEEAGFDGGAVYSNASDFFFQVVFVATAMSIVSGAVAERMKLWAFLLFTVVMTGVIYPIEGSWTWGGQSVFGWFELSVGDNGTLCVADDSGRPTGSRYSGTGDLVGTYRYNGRAEGYRRKHTQCQTEVATVESIHSGSIASRSRQLQTALKGPNDLPFTWHKDVQMDKNGHFTHFVVC